MGKSSIKLHVNIFFKAIDIRDDDIFRIPLSVLLDFMTKLQLLNTDSIIL